MNAKIIGLLFVLLFINLPDSLKRNNHLDKEELKGQVKSVKEVSYRIKPSGNTVIKVEKERVFGGSDSYKVFNNRGNYEEISYYGVDDSFIGKYTYQYDNEDHNTQVNWLDSEEALQQKHQYEYDKKGNATVYKMIYSDERGLYFTDSIQYDTNRNKIKEIRYFPNTTEVINKKSFTYTKEGYKAEERSWENVKRSFQYTLNSKDKKTEQKEYDENKTLVRQTVYDDAGNKIEEKFSSPINSTKIVYTYNSKGYLIKTLQTDTSNDYDSAGNLIDIFKRDTASNYKVLRTLTDTYTYDKEGNWINKTTSTNDTPVSLIEREIIYY